MTLKIETIKKVLLLMNIDHDFKINETHTDKIQKKQSIKTIKNDFKNLLFVSSDLNTILLKNSILKIF